MRVVGSPDDPSSHSVDFDRIRHDYLITGNLVHGGFA
jgi:hypothetical protein